MTGEIEFKLIAVEKKGESNRKHGKTKTITGGVRCDIFPNYSVRKDGFCKRYDTCHIQGHTKDSRCKAKGRVLR